MDKDQKEQLKFLEQQLQWTKERDFILSEISNRLIEMKKIAEYALNNELALIESAKLNGQLNVLKNEIHSLEKQLNTVVH